MMWFFGIFVIVGLTVVMIVLRTPVIDYDKIVKLSPNYIAYKEKGNDKIIKLHFYKRK